MENCLSARAPASRDFGNAPSSVFRKARAAINTLCSLLGAALYIYIYIYTYTYIDRDKSSSINARCDPFIFLILSGDCAVREKNSQRDANNKWYLRVQRRSTCIKKKKKKNNFQECNTFSEMLNLLLRRMCMYVFKKWTFTCEEHVKGV